MIDHFKFTFDCPECGTQNVGKYWPGRPAVIDRSDRSTGEPGESEELERDSNCCKCGEPFSTEMLFVNQVWFEARKQFRSAQEESREN